LGERENPKRVTELQQSTITGQQLPQPKKEKEKKKERKKWLRQRSITAVHSFH
jgi:hypothetical protein